MALRENLGNGSSRKLDILASTDHYHMGLAETAGRMVRKMQCVTVNPG